MVTARGHADIAMGANNVAALLCCVVSSLTITATYGRPPVAAA